MRLNNLPSEFQKALPILEKIKEHGFEVYFVGGSVRDVLLKRPIHDVDIATSAYPVEIKSIFSRTVDVGIEHGTVLVLNGDEGYEVTTFRTEDVYVDYRRPSHVSFVRSLEEDLKRRDFTINAFALAEDGTIIDKFSGLGDLENHILRAVGRPEERFQEDALRILRGFRFAAHLDFTIEDKTLAAMSKSSYLLEKISIERSFIELDKLLMSPYWKKGLAYLIETEAYYYLPGLTDKYNALLTFKNDLVDASTFQSSEQAWAALCLALDVADVSQFLRAWKTSVHFQKDVSTIVNLYRIRQIREFNHYDLYKSGASLLHQAENLRLAFEWDTNDENLQYLEKTLTIRDKSEICVNGAVLMKELGFTPGPALGDILKKIEKAIVLNQLDNDKEAILAFIRKETHE